MNLFTQPFVSLNIQKQMCTCPKIKHTDCNCDRYTLFGALESSDCPVHVLKPVASHCLIHASECWFVCKKPTLAWAFFIPTQVFQQIQLQY